MKKIILLLLISLSLFSCEKDDICDASNATTPRLVIEFYDNSVATPTLKSVTNLKAVASGMQEGVVFNNSLPVTNPLRYLTNSNKIYLPLNPSGTTTTYSLKYDFGGASENEDIVTYNYATQAVYVSRACGYKYLFNLTNTNTNILSVDSNNWIKNIMIAKPNLESENEVHIKMFF
jgi:hypothetical protein